MKKTRMPIVILTCLLMLAIGFFAIVEARQNDSLGLSAVVFSGNYQEKIICQEIGYTDENQYCMFFPGYADLSETVLRTDMFCSAYLNGQKLDSETFMSDLELNNVYEFELRTLDETRYGSIMFVQSKKLATMYIDTASGNMEYVHQDRENKESGKVALYDADGKVDCRSELKFIKGRGNSTWKSDKKPYNIKLNREANLLGMGTAETWVLLAQTSDQTYAKSKMIYDFADRVGISYSPDCDWVDLYLNGEYAGVYLLCEHVEIHPERVDIDAEGSFLVTLEGENRLKERGYPYTAAKDSLALRIRYADMSVENVESIWVSARNAILAEDGIDPVSGSHWSELIDIDSWALRYLLDEVFLNYDGGYISQNFFYTALEDNPRIYAGPVWDMDLTFSSEQDWWMWQTKTPYCIHAGRPKMFLRDDTPLFYSLLQKEEFHQRVLEFYQNEFLPELAELLTKEMEEYPNHLLQAAKLDTLRWYCVDFEEWMRYQDEAYLMEMESCQEFLAERIQFLNSLWLEEETYYFVQIKPNSYNVWGNYAVRPGELLPEIALDEGVGLYYFDTDQRFDFSQPVNEDLMLYMAEVNENP